MFATPTTCNFDNFVFTLFLQAAAHCFEEAVLLNPVSAAYHSRLAEVYYTLGEYAYF